RRGGGRARDRPAALAHPADRRAADRLAGHPHRHQGVHADDRRCGRHRRLRARPRSRIADLQRPVPARRRQRAGDGAHRNRSHRRHRLGVRRTARPARASHDRERTVMAPAETTPERHVTGADIVLDSVVKRYRGQRTPAVARLDLAIAAGDIAAFVGPSGCGKTTTLKMSNRLIEPTEGRILIGGRDVTKEDPDTLRQGIGYVIQSGGLFPHWSVAKNIGAIPRVLGWDRKRIAERTEYLLDLVGLDPREFAHRLPKDMSGGQQQRVGVARALAADPPVLLMDEPFGAVDPITRIRLQDSLLAIQQELSKTIVIVTHNFEEATKLGDKVLILSAG